MKSKIVLFRVMAPCSLVGG